MSNQIKWIPEHGIFFPISADFKVYPSPGPGIFNLVQDPNPMSQRLGLQKVAEKFEFPFKVYDLGIDEFIEKIKKTWNSEYVISRNQNLGIIFNGIKGTGKTISAKILCNEINIPIIIINQYTPGMIEFVQMLEFECVIFLDEAEKVFRNDDPNASQALLKMIDGVMNKSRKLYILTTNTLNINENLVGRPGRIKYIKTFSNISAKAINQYVDENLEVKEVRADVMELVNSLEVSTIDTLKSIVDEANIHGRIEDDNCLNIQVRTNYVSVLYMDYVAGREDIDEFEKKFNEAKTYIKKYGRKDKLSSWLYSKWDRRTDPEYDWYHENDAEEEERDPVKKPSGGKLNAVIGKVINSISIGKGKIKENPAPDCPDSEICEPDGGKTTEAKVEEPNHWVDDYLANKFGLYTDTIRVKGTKLHVGTRTENFGEIFKEDKDGWLYSRYGELERRFIISGVQKNGGMYRGELLY